MFQPGIHGVLPAVQAAAHKPGLVVRGVVSELPEEKAGQPEEEGAAVHVDVIKDTERVNHLTTTIVEPEGIQHPASAFALAELSHKDFKHAIGNAIVHSKTLVIDPFTDNPTVITCSHNFTGPASIDNDENFIIIKGDKPLAEAYAVNIMAAYDRYRYRAALAQDKGLSRTPGSMVDKLEEDPGELQVWNVAP